MASTLVASAQPTRLSPKNAEAVHFETVDIHNKPDTVLLLGQAHFSSAVEDVYEVLTQTTHEPVHFGIAYMDEDEKGTGTPKLRGAGNSPALTALAKTSALAIGAPHTFVALLQAGLPPAKWLAAVRALPQVARVYCATDSAVVHVVVAASSGSHGRKDIVAVSDGMHAAGFGEDESEGQWLEGDQQQRRLSHSPPRMSPDQFLQRVGYKQP